VFLVDVLCHLPNAPDGLPGGSNDDSRCAYQQPDGVQAQTGNDNVRHRSQ
jgi:hypothetical protein